MMLSGTGYAYSGVDIKNVQYFVPWFIRKLGFVRRRGSTGLCSVTVVARLSNVSAPKWKGTEFGRRGHACFDWRGVVVVS